MRTEEKRTILIADNSKQNRERLISILGGEYELLEAENGIQAVDFLKQDQEEISLILLAVHMPELDGFGVLEAMQENHWNEDIPVIIVSAEESAEMVQRAYDLGVTDYIRLQVDPLLLRRRVENTIRLFAKQRRLIHLMELQNQTLRDLRENNYRLKNLDELTGLLNLDGFKARMEQILAEGAGKQYALWYCDIKSFKFINASFGYETGDRLLQRWAQIVLDQLRPGESCARSDSDRLVVLTYYEAPEELEERFHRMVGSIEHYLTRPGKNYQVEISAGIYRMTEADRKLPDLSQMMNWTIIAAGAAKRQGGSCCLFFTEEMWRKQQREVEIRKHLQDAMANHEIMAWYQPQYDYVNKRITGAEALCRWNHAKLGWLSPAEFIPVLEESGQIAELDHFIWEETCRNLSRWQQDEKLNHIPLSVNISRKDIQSESFCEVLMNLVRKYDIPPALLHLEITESAYTEESEELITAVKQLQELGFVVEMDDFGSGFSSLNILKDMPVNILKLDMKFIGETEDHARGNSILDAVISMAHTLGIRVIAEGVETEAQAEMLRELNCHLMQGYYFAKPMTIDKVEKLI